MKKYTAEELKGILELHKKWIYGEYGGSRANLCDADLCDADLRAANLCDADLRRANLWNLTGNRLHVKTIALEKYTITYTADYLQIGCQRHTFEEWFNFDDEKIGSMNSSASEWWAKWRETIFKLIEMSPAEPTGFVEKKNETTN
jgi:uncharacterized protein YjbI with pentapeptide repeats